MATADRIHVRNAASNQDSELSDHGVLDKDALSRAAAHGDLATVRQLLAQGINPDQRNTYGRTPLQVNTGCSRNCYRGNYTNWVGKKIIIIIIIIIITNY